VALRLPGKSERRLALAISVTAILPLIAAIFLANSMFSQATAIWFKPEVGEQLDRGVALYKDYVNAIKDDMRHQTDAIAADESLRLGAHAHNTELVESELNVLFPRFPELVSLTVEDDAGNRLASRDRGRPVNDATERKLEVLRPLWQGDDAPTLHATFAIDRKRLDELQTTGDVVTQYHQIENSRADLYGGYVRAFAVLLSLTIALTLASGIVIAQGVTRRINRLANAIERVGRGDFSVRVPVTGSDELTDLASTFNRMLGEMQRSSARIEFLQRIGAWQEMAQRLAHEIKNPLTPIQLAVQECHRRYKGEDPKYRELLDTTLEIVEEEVGTLRRLVGDFSAFARLPHVALEDANLGDFMRECKDQLGHLDDASAQTDGVLRDSEPDEASVAATNVQVSWDVPEEPVSVAIDRQMLRRVLINLVRNAVQAIRDHDPKGEGRVVVRATKDPDGASIMVDDNGPGVAPAERERIFDPYFTTKTDGTGLGLAIVKKIVVEHGGTIDVSESTLGGASFVIRLPLPTPA